MTLWVATWFVPAALQFVLSVVWSDSLRFESPLTLFWLVVVAAAGCVVTSGAVIIRAVKRREAELGYIGLFFLSVSVLPLVHGLTTPGVLYDDNSATIASVQLSIVVGLLLAAPILGPASWRRRQAFRLWLPWSLVGGGVLVGIAMAMLVSPNSIPALETGTPGAMIIVALSLGGCITLSRRHLYMAQVAASPQPLILSAGYGLVGASSLVWLGSTAFSAGFWVAHVHDVTGVFASSVGALVVLRSTSKVRNVIDPVLTTDPLAALELGMDPVVHRFVADLEAKDSITRDHVVRTAELAIEVGMRCGLSGRQLRELGLAALLHDIGKLEIPDAILNKPDRLTEGEYAVMKHHAHYGQVLAESSPSLAGIGPLIRGHHERVDGGGYPDGHRGDAIPLGSRIIAVCDAFDAMANTRQYRDGMGTERALAILAEHAGSQWDVDVVQAALPVIARHRDVETGPALDAVGRDMPLESEPDPALEPQPPNVGCDCVPALS